MLKIGVVGCGSWGTAILKLLAENVQSEDLFDKIVMMYIRDEIYEGRQLSDYINNDKINPIYLKNIKLPNNIVGHTDLKKFEVCDVLIVCLPHKFIEDVLRNFKCKNNLLVINLSKGVVERNGKLMFPSDIISNILNVDCCCLMGANIALDVAQAQPSCCTIGYHSKEQMEILSRVFPNNYFKCDFLNYSKGIEICGSLKNVICLGFGILEGLGFGFNTKALYFNMGLREINNFCKLLDSDLSILESCCIPDLLASCSGGRNYKYGIALGSGENKNLFNSSTLEGLETSLSLYNWLKINNHDLKRFPIIKAIYNILYRNEKPAYIINVVLSK